MKCKILIAVPTFENIKPECFKSIFGLTNPENYNLFFDYVKGYDCARARNEIAKLALKHNFDYVLMIDSDVSVPKDTAVKLLECESDIALGWYYKKRTKTDQTVIYDFGKDYTDKNVFRKMPYPYFKYVIYDNDSILSEDLYFCTEARKYGMNIRCNPNVKGNHIYEVLM